LDVRKNGKFAPGSEKSEIIFQNAASLSCDGNVSAAARQLGISRNTRYRKLKGP